MVLNSSPAQSLSLCYCYAHEDAALLADWDSHLGRGSRWLNRDISEGGDWRSGMDERLNTANILLLLVTEHLVDSGYCDGVEMREALKRHEAGEIVILPVILRPVDWKKTALGSLPTLPRDGQPVMNRGNVDGAGDADDVDEAFEQVVTAVDAIAEELEGGSPTLMALPAITPTPLPEPQQADELQASLPDSSAITPTPLPESQQADELQKVEESSPEQLHHTRKQAAPLPETQQADEPGISDLSDVATTPLSQPQQAAELLQEAESSPEQLNHTYEQAAPLSAPQQADEPGISDLSDVATTPLSRSRQADGLRMRDSSDIATMPFPIRQQANELQTRDSSVIDTAPLPSLRPADELQGRDLSDVATIPVLKSQRVEVPATRETLARDTHNPYKGLHAFTSEDASDFFGRTAFIDKLALLIENMPTREKKGDPSSRLLTVIGPAGAGKSSVVMAGLIPSLRAGGVFDSADWIYLDPIVPGEHPVEALAQTLLVHFPEKDLQTVYDDLQYVAGLHEHSTNLIQQASAQSTHVVLVIDQFEKLFTLASREEERRHFINLLVHACTRQQGPLIVILTLRTDFAARLAQYSGLAALVRLHQAVPPAPTQDELQTIITEPARLAGVHVEESLVDTLLSDTRGLAEVLPHLQFTLTELFQQRTGDQLTLQAYRELGGVTGALAQRAEQTYRALPSHEHRLATYGLFLNLVDLGTAEQGPTLLRVKRSDFNVGDNTQQIQESIDAFVKAGLLRIQDGQSVEISHEIVMKAWPRLAEWLRIAREDKFFQQTLTRDVAEWERQRQAKTRLYRGVQLKKARSWAARHNPSRQEAAFLQASTARRSHFLVNLAVISLLLVALLGAAGGYYISRLPSPLLVTTTANSGTGSLRWCLANAPTGSTITFDPRVRGTITFTGGNLTVGNGKELTLKGPGAGRLALRSGDTGSSLVVPAESALTVSGLSFQGSKRPGRSILSNNGVLTLNNSVISGNSSSGDGGGIFSSDGILTLNNSVVSGNSTVGNGGGIYFYNGTLTLNNSVIMQNMSPTGNGGGLYFFGGILNMRNSTIASNSSIAGGGIYSSNNTLMLTNDTISDNSATSNGGGIFSYNSTLTLDKSTVFNNITASNGGGIAVNSANSPTTVRQYPVVLERSIVAGNHGEQGLDVSGTVITKGYNLFEYFAGANFVDPQKLHATDKEFNDVNTLFIDGTLDKNGGPTPTHALLAGSPAIDAIPVSACDLKTAATDQRGVKRPQGSACDIGAYEYQPHP